MTEGRIVRALSGFYYVDTADGLLECKARGKFRLDGTSPLVGDRVQCSMDNSGKGRIDRVLSSQILTRSFSWQLVQTPSPIRS